MPYTSPPVNPTDQMNLDVIRGTSKCNLTFQVVKTDQPALLSMEASKKLGVLTLYADFVRQCFTIDMPSEHSAACSPPTAPDLLTRAWPKPGTLNMEVISQNCSSLFQGLGYLGPPIDFDMDSNVKPIDAPIHHQPISKLGKIKAALDAYEKTGQLVRVFQPTPWISNRVV